MTDLVRAEVGFRSREVADVEIWTKQVAGVHGAPDAERKDGSIDILVERFDGESPYVPAGRSTWHVTTGEGDARKVRAWARAQISAPAVRSERDSGAASVLVLVARTSARQGLPLDSLGERIRVLTAEQIAAWATRHNYGVRLNGKAGVQPVARALESILGGDIPFQWTEDRLTAKERIWRYLTGASQEPIHIEGAAGIGKTRLTLEVLHRLSGFGERALYARDGQWTPALAHDLLRGIESDAERTAILLLDECDPGNHRKWAEQVQPLNARSLRVWLITISTSTLRDDDDAVVLEPLLGADIVRFLRAAYQLPEETLRTIAEASDGFIKAAVFLADYVVKNPLRMQPGDWAGRADREGLFMDALGTDADLVGPVALLKEATAQDIEIIGQVLELKAADIERAVGNLGQKGLAQPRLSARYLTPDILANTLALRQVRTFRMYDRLVRLFESLLHRGRVAMLERLVPLRSDRDVDALLQKILEKIGGSGAPPAGHGRDAAEYLSILLIAHPAEAFAIVRHWVDGAEPEAIAKSRSDFSPLVRVLESLAHADDLFEGAAAALATLAESDTPYGEGGPATKRWTALFSIGLARTAASNEKRVRTLTAAASHGRVSRRRLAMRAATQLISPSGFWLSDDLVVSRPWDGADVGMLFESAWSVLIAGLLDEDAVADIAAAGIRHNYKHSLRFAPEPTLQALERAPLDAPRVRSVLRAVLPLEQFSPHNASPVRARLSALAKRLEGTTFGSRLHYWVGEGSPGETSGIEGLQEAKRAWDDLAREAHAQPTLLSAEREWLSSPDARSGFLFGHALGRLDSARSLLPLFEEWTGAGRGGLVVVGYLVGQRDAAGDPALDPLLDDWARRGSPFSATVAEVTWRGHASERALQRWLQMVRTGAVPAGTLALTIWGKWHGLHAAAVLELLSCAGQSGDAGACAGALTVAGRWLEAHSSTEANAIAVEQRALSIIDETPRLFSAAGAPGLTARGALGDILLRVMAASPTRATDALLNLLLSGQGLDSDVLDLLAQSLRRDPRTVLSFIERRLDDDPARLEEVLDDLHELAPDVFETLGRKRAYRGRYLVPSLHVSATV